MKLENKIEDCDLYAMLINAMPYGVIVTDLSGKFLLWNKTTEIIFSVKLMTSTMEKWVSDFGVYTIDKVPYKTEDLPMFRAMMGESVVGVKMYIENATNPNGTYLKVSSYPLLQNGEIKAATIIFEDITKEQTLFNQIINDFEEMKTYLRNELNIDYKNRLN